MDDNVQEELDGQMLDSGNPGNIVAIAQSWYFKGKSSAQISPFPAYWLRDTCGFIKPNAYRMIDGPMKAPAARCLAAISENINANKIQPHILDMATETSVSAPWIDAFHTRDAILLMIAGTTFGDIMDGARRGRLPFMVRLLSVPATSQHARLTARARTNRFLSEISTYMRNEEPGLDTPRLVVR